MSYPRRPPTRRPPRSPPLPYTTLFRSDVLQDALDDHVEGQRDDCQIVAPGAERGKGDGQPGDTRGDPTRDQRHRKEPRAAARERSEEHTSELQSRENLVCRLLLEKKKT